MQRPEQQLPQSISEQQAIQQQATLQPLQEQQQMQTPKMTKYQLMMLRLTGLFLVVASGYTLYKSFQSEIVGPMSLLTKVLAIIVALFGISMMMVEGMEKLTGQLMSKAFPDFPQYGPPDNGQLYGENMVADKRAAHPHDIHQSFPMANTLLSGDRKGFPVNAAFSNTLLSEEPMNSTVAIPLPPGPI